MSSPVTDKLVLYTDRFRARTDVYAVRWDNARTGASGWMPAVAGGWRKGTDRKAANYLPLTAEVVSAHLVGRNVARFRNVETTRPLDRSTSVDQNVGAGLDLGQALPGRQPVFVEAKRSGCSPSEAGQPGG